MQFSVYYLLAHLLIDLHIYLNLFTVALVELIT